MSNPYYNHGTWPATSSSGSSALARSEMDAVAAGFALLPTLAANGGKFAVVNAGANALVVSSNLSESGTVVTIANSLTVTGAINATGGVAGNVTGNVTGNVSGSSGSTTGNAATATALATARAINGVNFDGTAPITIADSTRVLKAGDTMIGNLLLTAIVVGTLGVTVTNNDTGTGSAAGFLAANSGTDLLQILMTSTGYTAVPLLGARAGAIAAGGTGGIALMASNAAGTIRFATGGQLEQMRLDAQGWLGIAKAPSTLWAPATFRGIEMGFNGSSVAVHSQSTVNALYMVTNYYFDGAEKRNNANPAAQLRMYNDGTSAFLFNVAATGAANSTITWTKAFQITAGALILDGNDIELGWKDTPASGNTTAALADRGKCLEIPIGGLTLPSAVFANGHTLTFFNVNASAITITQGAGLTLHLAGTALTGNRNVAAFGYGSIRYFSSGVAVISGAGVS